MLDYPLAGMYFTKCEKCNSNVYYSELWDSDYCINCNEWLMSNCTKDLDCPLQCYKRPKRPKRPLKESKMYHMSGWVEKSINSNIKKKNKTEKALEESKMPLKKGSSKKGKKISKNQ